MEDKPKRENLHNLVDGYYDQLLGGKNADWIKCYAQGNILMCKKVSLFGRYDDTLVMKI